MESTHSENMQAQVLSALQGIQEQIRSLEWSSNSITTRLGRLEEAAGLQSSSCCDGVESSSAYRSEDNSSGSGRSQENERRQQCIQSECTRMACAAAEDCTLSDRNAEAAEAAGGANSCRSGAEPAGSVEGLSDDSLGGAGNRKGCTSSSSSASVSASRAAPIGHSTQWPRGPLPNSSCGADIHRADRISDISGGGMFRPMEVPMEPWRCPQSPSLATTPAGGAGPVAEAALPLHVDVGEGTSGEPAGEGAEDDDGLARDLIDRNHARSLGAVGGVAGAAKVAQRLKSALKKKGNRSAAKNARMALSGLSQKVIRTVKGPNEAAEEIDVKENDAETEESRDYAPTTLMGRMKAAAAMQEAGTKTHSKKKGKNRSLMEYSTGQLAGYTVKDMQRNDYMKNHWRDEVPDSYLGKIVFFLGAAFWGPYFPSAKVRMQWDFFVLFITFWACAYVPFVVCFSYDLDLNSYSRFIIASEILITGVFTLDIYVTLRTLIFDARGVLISNQWRIFTKYAQTWMILDLLAANPGALAVPLLMTDFSATVNTSTMNTIFNILQLVKLPKMIWKIHQPYMIKRLEETLGWSTTKMLILVIMAYFLLHTTACIFYVVSLPYQGKERESWVSHSGLMDYGVFDTYVAALYWSMSTMTTVGYGDIIPQHTQERIWCMIGMLIGVTAFAYFMSNMASIAAAMNTYATRMASQRAELDEFLKAAKVPKELAIKVRRYRHYVMEREYGSQAYDIIGGLSTTLRVEVMLYLHSDILSKVPLFQNKSKQFMAYLVSFFKLEFFAPGDIIMEVEDRSDEMYFIGEGCLDVYVPLDPQDASSVTSSRPGRPQNAWGVTSPGQKSSEAASSPDDPMTSIRHSIKRTSVTMMMDTSGDHAKHMFANDHIKMGELRDGEFFGEYSCLTGSPRTATVVAVEYSELYSLSKNDLEKMLVDWPEMATELYSLMDEFVTGLPSTAEDEEDIPCPVGINPARSLFGVVMATNLASRTRQKLKKNMNKREQMASTLSRIERVAANGGLDTMVDKTQRRREKEALMATASHRSGYLGMSAGTPMKKIFNWFKTAGSAAPSKSFFNHDAGGYEDDSYPDTPATQDATVSRFSAPVEDEMGITSASPLVTPATTAIAGQQIEAQQRKLSTESDQAKPKKHAKFAPSPPRSSVDCSPKRSIDSFRGSGKSKFDL